MPMASLKTESSSLPSLNLFVSKARFPTTQSKAGILSPKGTGHSWGALAPSVLLGGAENDKSCRSKQAVIVVLPDGSLSLFDEDEEVTVADVLRQHPGHDLVSEELPEHFLSFHERLHEGSTYFLCRFRAHTPPVGPARETSPPSFASPVELKVSSSQPRPNLWQRPATHRSLWRHNSANFADKMHTLGMDLHTRAGGAGNGVGAGVGGGRQHSSSRCPSGGLVRHLSTDLASLTPHGTSSESTPSSVRDAQMSNLKTKRQPRPLVRHRSAVAAGIVPAVMASEPVMSSVGEKLPPTFLAPRNQSHSLVRHGSTNLSALATASEFGTANAPWCTRCFLEGSLCLCFTPSPGPAADPSLQSTFPHWGYDRQEKWQKSVATNCKATMGETHLEDQCLTVEFVEGALSMVEENEAPEFKQSKTLWRLEYTDEKRSNRTDMGQYREEKDKYGVAAVPSPRASSCVVAIDGGARFTSRIKSAVKKLARWNSVPVKDF